VRVNLERSAHVGVPHLLLKRRDRRSRICQLGRKAVPEGVKANFPRWYP